MEQKQLLLPAPSAEALAKAEMEINEFLETGITHIVGTYEDTGVLTKTLCPKHLRKRFTGEEIEMTQDEINSYPEGYFRTISTAPRKRF